MAGVFESFVKSLPGISAWYRMGDKTDVLKDSSGNNRHGTLTPSIGLPPPIKNAPSLLGNHSDAAVRFTGLKGSVAGVDYAPWMDSGDRKNLTVFALVQKLGETGNSPHVVSRYDGQSWTNGFASWTFRLDGKNHPTFYVFTGNASYQASSSQALELNQTYSICATLTNGLIRVYVDGVLRASSASQGDGWYPSGLSLRIGRNDGLIDSSDGGFNGIIDEVIIADRAFNADEVANLHAASLSTLVPSVGRLVWHDRPPRYRHGVDRGVLYPLEGPGVAWNGLVSVDENHVGGEFEPLYSDGVRYLNLPSGRNYQATLSAYSTPEEFGPSNGDVQVERGLILTRQLRQRFGFAYRVMLGDGLGYQIHLVYNALATPTGRGTASKNETPSPNIPTWTIDAVPVESDAPRPTAHYILDSTDIGADQMKTIEGLLYGTTSNSPYLPNIKQIAAIINLWDPQIIMPAGESVPSIKEPLGEFFDENGTDGIHPLEDGMGDVQEVDVDGVYIMLPAGRLKETDVKGIYQLTE